MGGQPMTISIIYHELRKIEPSKARKLVRPHNIPKKTDAFLKKQKEQDLDTEGLLPT